MQRPDGGAAAAAPEERSLTRIRSHEREAARQIAEAQQAAAARIARATADAARKTERARVRGLQEADRRFEAALAALDRELAVEREDALARASRFRATVSADAVEIAQDLLPIVLPVQHGRGG